MTLILDPAEGVSLDLSAEAVRRGATVEECVAQLLAEGVLPDRNTAARVLLRYWREEGAVEEQRETWEALKQRLKENRSSYRTLFPEE